MSWIARVPTLASIGPPPTGRAESPEYPPRCEHKITDTRRKTHANGVVVIAKQCIACGNQCGAVPKNTVAASVLSAMKAWDATLADAYHTKRHEEWERRKKVSESSHNAAWWRWYEQYLQTPEWKTKRALVMARDKMLCQGCREVPATEVHHLTYVRLGQEMLFDLVAMCRGCHEKIHERK